MGTMRRLVHTETRRPPPFGGDVATTNLDLVLAALVALGLPALCAVLLQISGGALASLAVYYGLACVALVRWRKGTLDYHWPAQWPWGLGLVGLLLAAIITATNWGRYPDAGASPVGLLLTSLIWAPLNGALEQLSWQYVLDAWRNRWAGGWPRQIGTAVGVVLLLALVTLIHTMFWIGFLPAKPAGDAPWLTPVLNTLLTGVYVMLYLRARSMWPTAILHTLVDLQLVLLANYSILADL